MPQRSPSRPRLVDVLAGVSVVGSVAMAAGVSGSLLWDDGSFATMCVVTLLVAAVGGLVVVPLLTRHAPRAGSRSPTD